MNKKDLATLIRDVIENREVPEADSELAQNRIKAMLIEAAEYGFSEADFFKAILTPVWAPEPECGCHSCVLHRETSSKDLNSNGALL